MFSCETDFKNKLRTPIPNTVCGSNDHQAMLCFISNYGSQLLSFHSIKKRAVDVPKNA